MSDDLVARDLAVFWHPAAQMRDYRDFPPLPVVGARGSRITLADGSTMLDAISSWWCKSLGHGHPRLLAALTDQATRFEHVIAANATHQPVVDMCERILAAANGRGPADWGGARPGPHSGRFGKVFLADNGSTAVEVALKMALQGQRQRGQPGRTRIAAFENAYHGETAGAMSVSDLGYYKDHAAPLLVDCLRLRGLPYRSGPHDPRWMDASAEWPAIERQLDAEASTLAAIIYEPVLQGAGGMLLYAPDLLRRLRAWADAHGVWLIADEIAAGLGRLGPMLASHLAGTDGLPDIAVLSKGLTGGVMPMAAVAVPDAIYQLFDADWVDNHAFVHSNTYCGNPLACAVANAAFAVYADEDIPGHVARIGPTLRAGLAALARSRPILHGVRGCGMAAAVDLRRPDGSAWPRGDRVGYRVYREAVRRGALLRPLGDTMYLVPPLNVTAADAEQMIAILADSIDAVAG